MKKRFITLFSVLALILAIGATTAFAQEQSNFVANPQEQSDSVVTPLSSPVSDFDFEIPYGNYYRFSKGIKQDYVQADVFVQRGNMQSGDSVGFGLYDANVNACYVTAHVTHSIPDTFSLNYTNPVPGTYYLGATKGIFGYSNTITIGGKWYP